MKTTETLYQLTDDLLALWDLLEETEGELTPEMEAWMEEYGLKTRTKVDNMCRLEAELRARATAQKAEAKRLSDRARKVDADADRLKRLLELAMHRQGTRRLEGDHFTVSIQKHGGKRSLVTASHQFVPNEYCIEMTSYKVDADRLREVVESSMPDGYEGPVYLYADEEGALFAELEVIPNRIPVAVLQPRGESVRIR